MLPMRRFLASGFMCRPAAICRPPSTRRNLATRSNSKRERCSAAISRCRANRRPAGYIFNQRAMRTLPEPGRRVSPLDAPSMPRIVTPNTAPVFKTQPGASQYRFVGLNIGATLQNQSATVFNLLDFGSDSTSAADLPSDLIVDRCYIHGNANANVRRGVALNSVRSAVVDSFIDEIHEHGADAQAIGGWTGPGPYLIENNFLAAATENIMFGGSPPGIANLVPARHRYSRQSPVQAAALESRRPELRRQRLEHQEQLRTQERPSRARRRKRLREQLARFTSRICHPPDRPRRRRAGALVGRPGRDVSIQHHQKLRPWAEYARVRRLREPANRRAASSLHRTTGIKSAAGCSKSSILRPAELTAFPFEHNTSNLAGNQFLNPRRHAQPTEHEPRGSRQSWSGWRRTACLAAAWDQARPHSTPMPSGRSRAMCWRERMPRSIPRTISTRRISRKTLDSSTRRTAISACPRPVPTKIRPPTAAIRALISMPCGPRRPAPSAAFPRRPGGFQRRRKRGRRRLRRLARSLGPILHSHQREPGRRNAGCRRCRRLRFLEIPLRQLIRQRFGCNCDVDRSRTDDLAAADVGGLAGVSGETGPRSKSPINSSTRDTGQQSTVFRISGTQARHLLSNSGCPRAADCHRSG